MKKTKRKNLSLSRYAREVGVDPATFIRIYNAYQKRKKESDNLQRQKSKKADGKG